MADIWQKSTGSSLFRRSELRLRHLYVDSNLDLLDRPYGLPERNAAYLCLRALLVRTSSQIDCIDTGCAFCCMGYIATCLEARPWLPSSIIVEEAADKRNGRRLHRMQLLTRKLLVRSKIDRPFHSHCVAFGIQNP